MIAELAEIQRNIDKADRTDRRVQNLASYINVDTLRAVHKKMDGRKAVGIDKVTKDEYSIEKGCIQATAFQKGIHTQRW